MTNERIIELMDRALKISVDLLEEAEAVEKDTKENPINALANLKKLKLIEQESIVLKKIAERLALLSLANTLNGEGSD